MLCYVRYVMLLCMLCYVRYVMLLCCYVMLCMLYYACYVSPNQPKNDPPAAIRFSTKPNNSSAMITHLGLT